MPYLPLPSFPLEVPGTIGGERKHIKLLYERSEGMFDDIYRLKGKSGGGDDLITTVPDLNPSILR